MGIDVRGQGRSEWELLVSREESATMWHILYRQSEGEQGRLEVHSTYYIIQTLIQGWENCTVTQFNLCFQMTPDVVVAIKIDVLC